MAVRKTGQAAPAGGTKGASWDGKGRPPSWEAAYKWAEARGFSRKWLDIHLGPVVNSDPDDKTRPGQDDTRALWQLGNLIRKNTRNPVRDWVGDPNVPGNKDSYDQIIYDPAQVEPAGRFIEWQVRADRGEFRGAPIRGTKPVQYPGMPGPEVRSGIARDFQKALIEASGGSDALEKLAYWHKKIRGLKEREKALKASKYSDTRSVQAELKALVAEREEAQGKVNAIDRTAYVGDSARQKNRVALAAGEEASDSESTAGEPPSARLGAVGDDAYLWPAGMEEGSTSDETIVDDTRRGYLSKPFMDAQVKAWKKENPGAELPDTLAFYEDKQRFDPEDTRIKARYRARDLGMWERWDSNMIASMQKDFEAIGLYKAAGGKYNLGDWRGKESTFFAMLLAEANMEGLDWQEMLAEWKKNPPQVILDDLGAGSGGGRTPNPIQITNPDDIRSEARTASKSLTGQMRPGFDESMVGGFQGSEIAAGQALNTEGVAGTGGVVTNPATPAAYTEAQLRANSGPEVGAYSTLGAFNAILQELGLAG